MFPPLERNALSTSVTSLAETRRDLVRIFFWPRDVARPGLATVVHTEISPPQAPFSLNLFCHLGSLPRTTGSHSATRSRPCALRARAVRCSARNPAFRGPTTRPLMRLAYGVPLVAATYEAHRDLIARRASAIFSPWHIAAADIDIPAFLLGLTILCKASRVAH